MIDCYQADTAFLPIRQHASLVLEFARERELPAAALLQGTGYDEHDLLLGGCSVSPASLLRLLGNLAARDRARDLSFELGQHWLPGPHGAPSLALLQAPRLADALALLVDHQATFCPLLGPRLHVAAGELVLYWTDSIGAGPQLPFLVELHMAAVTGLCRWLSGERLPWRYCFNRTPPAFAEQHEVHLGSRLQFGSHFDAMVLDAAWLDRPWPGGSTGAMALALRQAGHEPARASRSLVQALYDYLLAEIRRAPPLEQAAAAFGISPATLKRQLARHRTHFQAVLDLVRTHQSLFLMRYHGYDQTALAHYFGFHDARNFRRSFKRWTGLAADLPLAAASFAPV